QHRPGHESGLEGQLGRRQGERLACRLLAHALDLVDHAARLDRGGPELDVTLAGAHADLDRLAGDRLVREHADEQLATTLDVAGDGAAGRLDLARGQQTVLHGLQAVLAEADLVAGIGQATVAALLDLAEFRSLGLQHCRLLLATPAALAARLTLATLTATLRGRRLFLLRRVQVEDLALVDPHLYADDAIGRVGLGEAVIDVGAQGVQRHTAFAVPLGTGDLGAVQAARDVHLDTQGAQAHGVADGTLHGAPEHDTALQLTGDRLGDQPRIQLRPADLHHIDVGGHAHHLRRLLAQALDVLTLLADHHARTGG